MLGSGSSPSIISAAGFVAADLAGSGVVTDVSVGHRIRTLWSGRLIPGRLHC